MTDNEKEYMYIMSGKNRIVKPDKRILLAWLAMGVIPLMVHLASPNNIYSNYSWFSSNETNIDFFLMCKMYGLIAVMAAMAVVVAADIYSGKKNAELSGKIKSAKIMFILAGLYILLSLLSAVFAHDIKSAFFGGYAQYEPVLVMMAYIVIFLFTYCYTDGGRTLMFLYGMLIAGVAVISFIGMMQYAGMDFFMSYIGRNLITMFSGIDADRVSLNFEQGRVYMSLYNPNYVGSYVALVLPAAALGLVIFKKIWQKAASASVAAMLMLCLAGSGSVTGMTAIIFEAVLIFMVMSAAKLGSRKKIIMAAGAVCVIAAALIVSNVDVIKDAVSKYRMDKDDFLINGMELSDDGVILDYRGEKLRVECTYSGTDTNLMLYNGSGDLQSLSVCDEYGGMTVAGDEFYSGLVIGNVMLDEDTRGFYVKYSGNTLAFTNDNDDGKYMYYNPFGKKTDEIANSRGILFDDYERFASGRGFIWSRTIPLLADNILIGCGPDNFVYLFPNNDYVSLINNGYYGDVVTRPHNMYLQTGAQTGVISLVLFILIYVVYLIQCIRIYGKKSGFDAAWMIGAAVMAGTFGYMVCGLANDSTVCVAPVYWGMLGLGYACNYIIKGQASK